MSAGTSIFGGIFGRKYGYTPIPRDEESGVATLSRRVLSDEAFEGCDHADSGRRFCRAAITAEDIMLDEPDDTSVFDAKEQRLLHKLFKEDSEKPIERPLSFESLPMISYEQERKLNLVLLRYRYFKERLDKLLEFDCTGGDAKLRVIEKAKEHGIEYDKFLAEAQAWEERVEPFFSQADRKRVEGRLFTDGADYKYRDVRSRFDTTTKEHRKMYLEMLEDILFCNDLYENHKDLIEDFYTYDEKVSAPLVLLLSFIDQEKSPVTVLVHAISKSLGH